MSALRFACGALGKRYDRSHQSRLVSRLVSSFLTLILSLLTGAVAGAVAGAQTVILDAPTATQLPNLTPRFTVRALGFPSDAGPLRYTVFITRNSTGDGPFVQTITTTSADTIVNLIVSRLLPDTATVYWKARVVGASGATTESQISGPRRAPKWLTLLYPNSDLGDQDTTRTPTFRWESGALDPEFGTWLYTIEILLNDRAEQTKAGFPESSYKSQPLQANTPYQWQLTAFVARSGESITQRNRKSFQIKDPALPTTTLLYQNFPNPFPSVSAFSTCFWFDVQSGGSRVSLDIVDLRGSLVKVILPPTTLEAGVYGRGPVGAGSNCDNRYVWNGTATDGRSVPGGVYLARFNATGLRTSFKKIVFKGR